MWEGGFNVAPMCARLVGLHKDSGWRQQVSVPEAPLLSLPPSARRPCEAREKSGPIKAAQIASLSAFTGLVWLVWLASPSLLAFLKIVLLFPF